MNKGLSKLGVTVILLISFWATYGMLILASDDKINMAFLLISILFHYGYIFSRLYNDRKLKKQLKKANSEITLARKEDRLTYHSLNHLFSNTKELSIVNSYWQEFRSSLVEVENLEGMKKEYYQTADAECFFNFDNLVKKQINSRMYAYIPQLLTGLGILGTFLGLSLGLNSIDLASGDIGQLNRLLESLKTSFYTSLFGMTYSISFSLIMNLHFGEIENIIVELKDKINGVFRMHVTDQVLDEIRIQLRHMQKSTDDMATRVANEMGEGFNRFIDSNSVMMSEMSKLMDDRLGGISNNLSGSFEKTVSDSMQKVFSEDFVNNFATITEDLINASRENLAFMNTFKNETMEIAERTADIKDKYVEMSNIIIEDFETLFSRTKEQIKNIQEIHEKTLSRQEHLETMMQDGYKQLNGIMESIKKVEPIIDALKTFNSTQETVVELWDGFKDAFDNVSETLEKGINQYTSSMDKTSDRLTDIIRKNISELQETVNVQLSNLFKDYDSNLSNSIQSFYRALEYMTEKLQDIDDSFITMSEKLEDTAAAKEDKHDKQVQLIEAR